MSQVKKRAKRKEKAEVRENEEKGGKERNVNVRVVLSDNASPLGVDKKKM